MVSTSMVNVTVTASFSAHICSRRRPEPVDTASSSSKGSGGGGLDSVFK